MKPVTPDMATLDNLRTMSPKYDARRDVFMLRSLPTRPATSFDCDGQFWMRLDVQSGEIVGLEIEDFQSVFLKQHPEMAQAWLDYRRRRIGAASDRTSQSFLVILAGFLRSFLSDCSEQHRMEMLPA